MGDGETDADRFMSVVPGGGWMIFRSQAEESWSEPVVAWALCADGELVPLEVSPDGSTCWPVTPGGGIEIWHPDSSSRQSRLRLQAHRDHLLAAD